MITIVLAWTTVNTLILCAFTSPMDSYGDRLICSQSTELRMKVGLCFNLDLGASLQQN